MLKQILENIKEWKTTGAGAAVAALAFVFANTGLIPAELANTVAVDITQGIAYLVSAGLVFFFKAK